MTKKLVRYTDGEVDIEDLEAAVMSIAEKGFGAAVAFTTYELATRVADMLRDDKTTCFYNPRRWENETPIYPALESVLVNFFNHLDYKGKTYWFDRNKSKASVLNWLKDDFRGTMENPY